jgi:lipopolysaccharide/colanic/teichoic acid biosynthesis glycosyltransferase
VPGRRLVLVGPEPAVVDLGLRLRSAAAVTVVGACVPQPAARSAALAAHGIPVVGRMDRVAQALGAVRADGVLVALSDETSGPYLPSLARQLRGAGCELLLAEPDPCGAPPWRDVDSPDVRPPHRRAKVLLDCVGAAVLLFLVAPVLLVLALVAALDGPGPVLVRERRVGQWGRQFDLLRFRGSRHRWGLDELPQLLNVLRGDMSLVGPRPEPADPRAGALRTSWLQVKPGLTGLWQQPPSPAGPDRPVGMDDYRRHWSLAMDLGILARTLRAAMRRGGC